MTSNDVWPRLVAAFGNQSMMARQLHVTRATVSAWKRRGRIPAHYVLQIEQKSLRQVTRYELRPDIYPVEPIQH